MNPEIAAKLRAPFPSDVVGQLPKVWCRACRDAAKQGRTCEQHRKVRCRQCGNSITEAHLHVAYVGHAEATDRLLTVDPEWTWAPVAFGEDGLPLLDRHGGLWIRLTVAGVTRLGYGHAEGKAGPDAVKEAIGDAIRNAAMRFGVALDMWGAKFKAGADDGAEHDEAATRPDERPAGVPSPRARALVEAIANSPTAVTLKVQYDQLGPAREAGEITLTEAMQLTDQVRRRKTELEAAAARTADPGEAGPPPGVTDRQHRRMHALWRDLRLDVDQRRARRLERTAEIIGRPIGSSAELTFAEAEQVIKVLDQDKRALTDVVKGGGG